MTSAQRAVFPVDAHVHFYSMERVGVSLEAAAENFRRVSGHSQRWVGAVLLVESSGERVFERLFDAGQVGGWTFIPVAQEPETVVALSAGRRILVVCGRQVRCVDGLEVLALGTQETFPDGESLEQTVDRVAASGAVVSIPWGFGKWMGQRGRQVRRLFEQRSVDSVYVGDSGGRVQGLRVPRIIRDAQEAGLRVLPGTDPFPCGSDHERIGSFGFIADIVPDEEGPWASLRGWLESLGSSPDAYGHTLGPARFVYNQVAIRLHKMTGRKDAG